MIGVTATKPGRLGRGGKCFQRDRDTQIRELSLHLSPADIEYGGWSSAARIRQIVGTGPLLTKLRQEFHQPRLISTLISFKKKLECNLSSCPIAASPPQSRI